MPVNVYKHLHHNRKQRAASYIFAILFRKQCPHFYWINPIEIEDMSYSKFLTAVANLHEYMGNAKTEKLLKQYKKALDLKYKMTTMR